MAGTILLVVASTAEGEVLRNLPGINPDTGGSLLNKSEIKLLTTGVGSAATAWSLMNWLSVNERPDLVINAGIAGSYKDDLEIGKVVMPVTDCFADSGIEDGDRFLALHEAGLISPDEFPFTAGILSAHKDYIASLNNILIPVRAITVNTATGSESSKIKLLKKFNPDIETMEGATFFYICAREKLPFLALRAISNMVEPRNKKNWDIMLALKNLSEKLSEVILTLD